MTKCLFSTRNFVMSSMIACEVQELKSTSTGRQIDIYCEMRCQGKEKKSYAFYARLSSSIWFCIHQAFTLLNAFRTKLTSDIHIFFVSGSIILYHILD